MRVAWATVAASVTSKIREAFRLIRSRKAPMRRWRPLLCAMMPQEHKIVAGTRAGVFGSHHEVQDARPPFDRGSGLGPDGPLAPVFRPRWVEWIHDHCFR